MTYPDSTPTGRPEPTSYWPPQTTGPQQPTYAPPPAGPPVKPVNPKLAFWTSLPGIIAMLAIAAGVALIIGVGSDLIAGPASKNFTTTITSCDATTGSLPTATVGFTITNTSSTVRSATVHIEYRDGDGSRLDTDTSSVRNISPGDTVRQDESTILDGAPTGTIRCEITGIG